jgi:hypothetical protein
MDDVEERPPKKYTLVYGADGKLYAVGKREAVPIEGGAANGSPVPDNIGQDVKNALEGPNAVEIPNGVENYVESKLAPYMAPAGSGVRVRVPKILE